MLIVVQLYTQVRPNDSLSVLISSQNSLKRERNKLFTLANVELGLKFNPKTRQKQNIEHEKVLGAATGQFGST